MSGSPRWRRLMEGGLVDVSRAGGVWTTPMGAGVEQPACPLPDLPRSQASSGCGSGDRVDERSRAGSDGEDSIAPVRRAGFRGLHAKRRGSAVVVTGRLRPARAGEKLTI
jgi:hypothetical protein